MKMLKCLFAALALGAAVSAGAAPAAAPAAIEIAGGWVRWLPGNLPAAGYLSIRNHGNREVTLVRESSPDYGNVMLHRSVSNGGVEHMEMVARLRIAPGAKVDFAPGGYHLMLMHARHPVAPGDEIHLKLEFSDGSSVDSVLKVRPPTQMN